MNRLDGSNISSTFSFDQLPSFREQERQRAINLKPLPSCLTRRRSRFRFRFEGQSQAVGNSGRDVVSFKRAHVDGLNTRIKKVRQGNGGKLNHRRSSGGGGVWKKWWKIRANLYCFSHLNKKIDKDRRIQRRRN